MELCDQTYNFDFKIFRKLLLFHTLCSQQAEIDSKTPRAFSMNRVNVQYLICIIISVVVMKRFILVVLCYYVFPKIRSYYYYWVWYILFFFILFSSFCFVCSSSVIFLFLLLWCGFCCMLCFKPLYYFREMTLLPNLPRIAMSTENMDVYIALQTEPDYVTVRSCFSFLFPPFFFKF